MQRKGQCLCKRSRERRLERTLTGAAEAAPQKARMAIAVEARIAGEELGVEWEGERSVGREGGVWKSQDVRCLHASSSLYIIQNGPPTYVS